MSTPLTIALMLESDGPGGAEVLLLRLAQELRNRGHKIHPIGHERGEGWLRERFQAVGFEMLTYWPRRSPDLRCVRHLAGLMRQHNVDIMHGHEFDGAVYGTAAARLVGRPCIISMHGNQHMTAAWKRRVALRWAFRSSQAVVAVSGQTKDQLDEDLGLRKDVIRVLHNGMPIRAGDAAPVRQELGQREDELLILAVGNLTDRKGHIFLLKALQQLESQGLKVPWRLAIAGGGGGPARGGLEAFAAEHGLADRLHILTYRDDVPDLMAAADIFVMPSLWEGLPLSILEAMLGGTPVIASDICGIPEAIVSEEHGILTPPGDVEALSRALRRMLTEPALRERLARQARDRALREFTIEAMTSGYESLYHSFLN